MLDNFGAGYSSLRHLQELPISGLKIDPSFIKCNLDNPAESALVSAIIAMARSLSLSVTAEGLETTFQVEIAKKHALHQLQGFEIHHPMPLSTLQEHFRVNV